MGRALAGWSRVTHVLLAASPLLSGFPFPLLARTRLGKKFEMICAERLAQVIRDELAQ